MMRKGAWDKGSRFGPLDSERGLQGSASLQTVQKEMMQWALDNIGRLCSPHGVCRSVAQ